MTQYRSLTTIPQDDANTLATLVRAREVERVAAQGFMLACVSNGLEVTEERMTPYLVAFNAATKALYRFLWELYRDGQGYGPRPGKTPEMRFSAKVRCDTRCTHASGSECVCSCGGINHATFYPGQFAHAANAAELVKQAKDRNREELKMLNSNPQERLLHLFGVMRQRERVADKHG